MNGIKKLFFALSCIAASGGVPAPAFSDIVDRGRDFAVYRNTVALTNATGIVRIQTNEFTVVENGLHYLDSGQWRESQDLIELTADGGAAAMRAPHTVYFQPNLNSVGAVVINTVGNRIFRTHIVGLYYFDAATGQSALVAPVQDSLGELLPPNQLLYRNAFDGVNADVRFTCTKAAFETDVILLEQPLPPESFGLSSATSRLEIWHEFLDSPEPKRTEILLKQESNPLLRQAMAAPDWIEETLDFGDLWFPLGRSFLRTPSDANGGPAPIQIFSRPSDPDQLIVAKQWLRIDALRSLLIESADWRDLQPRMASLPKRLAALDTDILKARAVCGRALPDRFMAATRNGEVIKTAGLTYSPTGYVWDYIVVSGSGSYVFNSGITYLLQNGVTFSSITFQPGAVIKYAATAYLAAYSSIACPPFGTLEVVLTSLDEDLFGESIGSGTPSYYDRALIVYGISSVTLQNLRVRWANIGPYFLYAQNATVRDSRLQNCGTGILAESSSTVTLINDTLCNVATPTLTLSGSTISGTLATDCGPLYTVANFAGLKQQESGSSVADTMGAVGPSHFVEILNGNASIAVYSKYTGTRISPTTTTLGQFFGLTVPSGPYAGTYPNGSVIDPRIVYDHVDQRWIVCGIDVATYHVLLAVSNGSDPVGNGGSTWFTDNWKRFLVPVGTCRTDFDTLGFDSNGIYINVFRIQCGALHRLAALPKLPFLDGTASPVQANYILEYTAPDNTVQPAVNFDPVTIDDPMWFTTGTQCRSIKWTGGLNSPPQWQGNWVGTGSGVPYLFLDPGTMFAPQLGTSKTVRLDRPTTRGMMAVVRKLGGTQYLWTCQHIGVNQAGSHSPVGNPPSPADRSAIEWYKVQTAPSPTLVASGRVYDTSPTNFKFYYLPSLTVNKNGDMVIGFSGSSAVDYISAYYTGRLNNGTMPALPIRYFAGKDYYDSHTSVVIIGDYSYTSLDPDGLTMWTVQEYAETRYLPPGTLNEFGTRIAAITPF